MTSVCDIIIPVWNLPEKTRRCLESILAHTRHPYRLILIDNASEKRTSDFLHSFQKSAACPTEIIRNERNLGNIKAVNQGIHLSHAPYVCILDNDTVVFPGWLEKLVETAESEREIGIVNPASNSLGSRKPWYQSWRAFAEEIVRREKGRVLEMATAMGFCMLVKRAVIEKIGGWCEDYGMGYYEDRDYSLRAAQAGFRRVLAREAFVYHEEHASFRQLRRQRKEKISASNRQLFENRFGASERIAFCFQRSVSGSELFHLGEEALRLARANHWISIFHPAGFSLNGFPEHSNIKPVALRDTFFGWNCLFQVLKKKKRFYRIYSDDPRLIQRLNWLRSLHGAESGLLSGAARISFAKN